MGIRMKEMKRIVVSLGLCAVMAVVPAGAVNAQDVNEDGAEIDIQELAEYDLEKGRARRRRRDRNCSRGSAWEG